MAKLGGIRALFGINAIEEAIESNIRDYEDTLLDRFRYAGEMFVIKARSTDTYKDRTGNLRSSIGYIILKDGQVVEENFEGRTVGRDKGREFALDMAKYYPTGFVLIGVAGMNYAAAVEAKNYDVITGSAPTQELMREILSND